MQPNLLVQVNFLVDDLKISGAYVKGMLIGKIDFEGDQGRLKNLVPKDIAPYMPDIRVDEVVCMVNPDKVFLLKVGLANGFSLSDLPLIGDKIPSNINVGINNLEIAYASGNIKSTNGNSPISKGLNFNADIAIGDLKIPLILNQGQQEQPINKTKQHNGSQEGKTVVDKLPAQKENTPLSEEGVKWMELNKTIGPIHIKRIGAKFSDGELQFLISASLAIGPLKICIGRVECTGFIR